MLLQGLFKFQNQDNLWQFRDTKIRDTGEEKFLMEINAYKY